jgi:phospholipid-binding lipoprotein MlaA
MSRGRSTLRLALPIVVVAYVLGCGAAAAAADGANNNDPLEPMNRGIFWFNVKLDDYVMAPAARGWKWILPAPARESVTNFFQNLLMPIDLVNNLLQAKFVRTGTTLARFGVNTTVGVLGLFDPATGWGLERHHEDFGQTLGFWGVPPGPYLVLPFWGSSNPRDTVGLVADGLSTVYPWFIPFYYTYGASAVGFVNARANVLTEVDELKRASLDYYIAVRNAYIQRREAEVHDRTGMSEEQQEDLYTIPDESLEESAP